MNDIRTATFIEVPAKKGEKGTKVAHFIGKDNLPICGAKVEVGTAIVITSLGANLEYASCPKCKAQFKKGAE